MHLSEFYKEKQRLIYYSKYLHLYTFVLNLDKKFCVFTALETVSVD